MSEYITSGEFTRWTEVDNLWKERMLNALEKRELEHAALKQEVAALKTNQQAAGTLSARMSAGISVLVTAVVNAVLAYIGGKT